MTVMPDQKHQGQWFHFSAQGVLQPGIKKTKQFSMAVNLTHDKQSKPNCTYVFQCNISHVEFETMLCSALLTVLFPLYREVRDTERGSVADLMEILNI